MGGERWRSGGRVAGDDGRMKKVESRASGWTRRSRRRMVVEGGVEIQRVREREDGFAICL